MKKLALILLGVFFTLSSKADCSMNGIWVFPTKSVVKQNTIIMINGYSMSQSIIKGLNKEYKIYLQSGNDIVKLNTLEINVGQFGITQAILKPESKLIAGLIYRLKIDNLPNWETLSRYNPDKSKSEPIDYEVLPEIDTEKPTFTSQAKELKKTLVYYGCGPSENVVFNCPIIDSSEFLIRATVKSLKTGVKTSYYIEPIKKQILIGHGMCSGAFSFNNGNDYEIEFSILDSSGNTQNWTTKPIKFTKPTDKNSQHEEDTW